MYFVSQMLKDSSIFRRMVNKLREALDANPSIPQTPVSARHKQTSDISIRSTNKEFEGFLKYVVLSQYLWLHLIYFVESQVIEPLP